MQDWLGDVALRMHVKAWKLKSACDGFMMCGEIYTSVDPFSKIIRPSPNISASLLYFV